MERRAIWLMVGLILGCQANGAADVETDVEAHGTQDVADVIEVRGTDHFEAVADIDRYPNDDLLRLNHIQCKGTHNSYHLLPDEAVAPDWLYEHAPLNVQLEEYGVRQVELDIHWHQETGEFQVYHVPILDDNSSCRTLTECLQLLKSWSDLHSGHHPLFVFIEPKDDLDVHSIVGHYDELDAAIRAVWPPDRLVTPADVVGGHGSMQEALAKDGWPLLGATRNKALFHLLDSGLHRDNYLGPEVTLANRVMHVRGGPETTWGSFVEYGNAQGNEVEITKLALANYIVRSTADDTNPDKLANNPDRAAAALVASHVISTDFPAATSDDSYFFTIPQGTPSRCHPVMAPAWCVPADVELLP